MIKKRYICILFILLILITLVLNLKKIIFYEYNIITFISTICFCVYLRGYLSKDKLYLSFGLTRKEIINNIYKVYILLGIFLLAYLLLTFIIKAILGDNIESTLIKYTSSLLLYLFICSLNIYLQVFFNKLIITLLSIILSLIIAILDIINIINLYSLILILPILFFLYFSKIKYLNTKIKLTKHI